MRASMRALGWAREQTESDESDDGESEDERNDTHRPGRRLLSMRCYVCAGTGQLEMVDDPRRPGRPVRCIACRGTGRVIVK